MSNFADARQNSPAVAPCGTAGAFSPRIGVGQTPCMASPTSRAAFTTTELPFASGSSRIAMSPTTSIQVAPAAYVSAAGGGGGGKRGRAGASGGRRDARMSWYTTRMSFFFLFILFLFAMGNVAGLIYFFKHGGGSVAAGSLSSPSPPRDRTRADPLSPPLPTGHPAAGVPDRDTKRHRQDHQPPSLLADGGNTALEHENGRRLHRGRRVLLDVFRHDFGPVLLDKEDLFQHKTDATLSAVVDASALTWLPAPFVLPLLQLAVHSSLASTTRHPSPPRPPPSLWLRLPSAFAAGFSTQFDSIAAAQHHFYTLLDGGSGQVNNGERTPGAQHLQDEDAAVKVAQHGKSFQNVYTYPHRGVRFAEQTDSAARQPSTWPVGAWPNWASPVVAAAMDRLLASEAILERALHSAHPSPLARRPDPSSSSCSSSSCFSSSAARDEDDRTLPAAFLPIHWLSAGLAPSDAAEAAILRAPDPVAGVEVDTPDPHQGPARSHEALRRALARAGVLMPPRTSPSQSLDATTQAQQQQHRRALLDWSAAMTFCDPADSDFTSWKDAACLRYLSDPSQWLAMKPMTSTFASGRTIKFLLSFRHGNVSAIVKVPQTGFAVEPGSEVAAFHVDRLLGFQRVPPTALVEMPLAYMRAAAASLDNAFYVRWVETYVLNATATARARHVCRQARTIAHLSANGLSASSDDTTGRGRSDALCLWVSVQLWMHDVDAVETTLFDGLASDDSFLVPKQSRTIPTAANTRVSATQDRTPWVLREDVSETVDDNVKDEEDDVDNRTWPPPPPPHWLAASAQHATTSSSSVSALSEQAAVDDSHVRARLFYAMTHYQKAALALERSNGLTVPSAALTTVNDTTASPIQAALRALMWKERHDQLLFDVIIDNQDRWEGHNLFVVAGCGAPVTPTRGAAAQNTSGSPACVRARQRAVLSSRSSSRELFSSSSSSSSSFAEWNVVFRPNDITLLTPSRLRVPHLIYLDQGSGFFTKAVPRDSPFNALAFATADNSATDAAAAAKARRGRDDQAQLPSASLFCQRLYFPTLRRLESLAQQAVWLHRQAQKESSDGADGNGGVVSPASVRAYVAWRHALLMRETHNAVKEKEGVETGSRPSWYTAQVLDNQAASLDASEVGRALYELLRWRLPPGLGEVVPHHLIEAACRRVWSVLANRQRCAARYGETNLYLR